ncbi:MAG: inositol monophosphatase family protein [Candidatus Bathyarchaeia archaeon]
MDLLREIAREAGRQLESNFRKPIAGSVLQQKTRFDYSTPIDKLVEDGIIRRLKEAGVDCRVVAEETGEIALGSSDCTLVVDPLDGTVNYSRGDPDFCVGLALKVGGNFTFAIVYAPHHDEFFEAERGKGAFLNGERITVSGRSDFDNSVLAFEWWYTDEEAEAGARCFKRLLCECTRNIKANYADLLDLAYLACGRRDGLVFAYNKAEPWDIAPGAFIVEEAGGIVTDGKGNPWHNFTNSLIAGNPSMHAKLLSLKIV